MNTDEPSPAGFADEERVLSIQIKLHRWAADVPTRRFDDLFNLICDPVVLADGLATGQGEQGRSLGWSGRRNYSIHRAGARRSVFLEDLRADLSARPFGRCPCASG